MRFQSVSRLVLSCLILAGSLCAEPPSDPGSLNDHCTLALETMGAEIFWLVLPVRVRKGMARKGAETMGDVLAFSKEEFLAERNFGKDSLGQLESTLAALGFRLKPRRETPVGPLPEAGALDLADLALALSAPVSALGLSPEEEKALENAVGRRHSRFHAVHPMPMNVGAVWAFIRWRSDGDPALRASAMEALARFLGGALDREVVLTQSAKEPR